MKARLLSYPLLAALVIAIFVALRTTPGPADPAPTTTTTEPMPTPAASLTVEGKDAAGWHRVARRYLSRVRSLSHALTADPETSSAIRLACVTYGNCGWLWRVARCESGYSRYARNASSDAAGVFQFLASTWSHTPAGRAGLSVYDPYANALMAGWLAARGGRGQWVCQ